LMKLPLSPIVELKDKTFLIVTVGDALDQRHQFALIANEMACRPVLIYLCRQRLIPIRPSRHGSRDCSSRQSTRRGCSERVAPIESARCCLRPLRYRRPPS
jgi:hypothetical protein